MAQDIRNGFVAVHPGGIFRRRVIDKNGWSVEGTAELMGVSRQMLHRVLSGQSSVTADMAIRMAELSDSRAETWLQLQNQFDLAQAVLDTGLFARDVGPMVREQSKQSR
jgi:addiction module HigA family antidote